MVILGVLVIVRLARGIYRFPAIAGPTPASIPAGALPPSAPAPTRSGIPLHLSPLSRQSITQLVLALAAQIVVSSAAWFFGQLHFWSRPRAFAPHNWTLLLLAPFVLSHIPYAILIYVLLKRPDRRAFTYAIAVPAVLILESLFSVSLIGRYYVHQPMGLVLLLVPWLIHIVIIALAYKAIQQTGLHPEPASLLVAALIAFAFFSLIHIVTPFLYRFIPYRFIPR